MIHITHNQICHISFKLCAEPYAPIHLPPASGSGVVARPSKSIFVETKQASREQLAIAEFADALLVIPKTLAVNAAKDSTELVGTLRAAHGAAQSAPKDDGKKKKYMRYGLDLLNGQIRDNVTAGVLEPTMSKVKSLKSAFEAAVSLLRIDDAIACAPGE